MLHQFFNLYKVLHDQPAKSFVLDGEIVALDPGGASDFNGLEKAGNNRDVHFYAFDLLHCEGDNLIELPLSVRQARLHTDFRRNDFLHIPAPLEGELELLVAKIREFGFEGIIAKDRNSSYQSGKISSSWLKMKLKRSDEFIVGGYIPGPNGIAQLIVGRFEGKKFKYVQSLERWISCLPRAEKCTLLSGNSKPLPVPLAISPKNAALTTWTRTR